MNYKIYHPLITARHWARHCACRHCGYCKWVNRQMKRTEETQTHCVRTFVVTLVVTGFTGANLEAKHIATSLEAASTAAAASAAAVVMPCKCIHQWGLLGHCATAWLLMAAAQKGLASSDVASVEDTLCRCWKWCRAGRRQAGRQALSAGFSQLLIKINESSLLCIRAVHCPLRLQDWCSSAHCIRHADITVNCLSIRNNNK